MIGVNTADGVEYITKFEHFRGLMPDETYEGVIEWLNKEGLKYKDIIDDLNRDLSSAQEDAADYELKCDGLEDDVDKTREFVQGWCDEIEEIIKDIEDEKIKTEVMDRVNKIYCKVD